MPHDPGDLLYAASVDAECAAADAESAAPSGTCRTMLDRILPGVPGDRHPADLSEGQRLALVLAVQLIAAPRALLLDEPTRGLDYAAKHHLSEVLASLAGRRNGGDRRHPRRRVRRHGRDQGGGDGRGRDRRRRRHPRRADRVSGLLTAGRPGHAPRSRG